MTTYTAAANGNWDADATWSGTGHPTAGDTAIIGSYTVTVATQAAECAVLTISGVGALVASAYGITVTGATTKTGTGNVTIGAASAFGQITWGGGTLTIGAACTSTASVTLTAGTITQTHALTVTAASQISGGTWTQGGTLTTKTLEITGGTYNMNANIIMSDASGAQILIGTGVTAFNNNGSRTTPRTITSAGGGTPTNRWYLLIYDVVGADTRTIDLDYLVCTGNYWYLANDNYGITFNGDEATANRISNVTPVMRDPKIDNHYIEGRNYSRVYHTGTWAGTVTISGTIRWDVQGYTYIRQMLESKLRLSFTSMYVHLGKCRIESARFSPKTGSEWVDFNIVLIEDN